MTLSIPFFRTTPLAALVAAALLSACGGGGAGGFALSDTIASSETAQGDDAAPLPPPTSDEAPPLGGETAPEPLDVVRESAASASCVAPTFARPRIAAWDLSRNATSARQALLAKFDFAVVGMSPTGLGPFASGVKQLNPNTKIAQYLNFADLKPTATSSEENYALVQEIQARHWWLTTAGGGLASWTGGSTAGINMSGWTTANPSGQRWPQFKAQFDAASFFRNAPQVEYAFTANTFARPRVAADWKHLGTDQPATDTTVQSAMRAGYAAYWTALRAATPNIKVMAGTDSDLSSPEYKGAADAAFLDGMIGRSWSIETWAGWDAMMRHYRNALANVKPGKTAIFVAYGATPTDYAAMRYGLASALLDDAHFMFRPAGGSQVPAMYDEYLAQLGKAVDPAPTAAASNGVWLRRYENGLVLVNPQKASASIDVGSGYKRLSGTQDPAVNNGQTQQTVTLGARQGLLMLKVPVPCVEPAPATTTFAKPKVAALDYSINTSDARKALLAKFDYVILGLSKSLGATRIHDFVSGVKKLNPAAKVGQYTIINELKCDMSSGEAMYPMWQEVNRNNWWLRNAAGQRVQWNTVYGACDINMTGWAARNAAGQTYAQSKWEFDRTTMFSVAPFDFMFSDNTFGLTRVVADWQRNGVDMPKGDPTASAAMRMGHAAYWSAVRASNPDLKVVGNADNDLTAPEYKGVLDGAYLEGAIGRSWSRETWAGWDSMMNYYRAAVRNTRNPDMVFLNAYAEPTDYATMRYALASSMMENGHLVYVPSTGPMEPVWFDEFGAPIGSAVDAPPTAPAQNGIWLRRYSNGVAIVNPSKTLTASIDVGAGYKRLTGTQDAKVNNGQAQRVVTLGPRQGLLMIRQ